MSVYVSATATATLTLTSGAATATVSVAPNSLPLGTIVSLYPVTTATALTDVAGPSYLVAFGLSWQTESGTSPASTAPVTLEITDPSIVAGDTIYDYTSSGLTAVGTATVNGSVTITFNSDPVFVLAATLAAQAPLSVTSLSGWVNTGLQLAASGGSGTGDVSFVASDGTASGCSVTGDELSAQSAGTCLVTATKAADATHFPVSSASATVTLATLSKPSDVTLSFANGKSTLSVAVKGQLSILAKRLVAGATLRVTGYAKGNAHLASARALAVAKYLMGRVRVHVARRLVTSANSNKVTVTTLTL
jgi:outer membrane protein OmpA-like peptidoglycan-associated protein